MRNSDRFAYLALGLLIGGCLVLACSWDWLRAPMVNTGFAAVPRLVMPVVAVGVEVSE